MQKGHSGDEFIGEGRFSGTRNTADDAQIAAPDAVVLTHSNDAAAERLLKFGEKYRFSLAGITIKDLVNEGRR